jgi:hypothetical protein
VLHVTSPERPTIRTIRTLGCSVVAALAVSLSAPRAEGQTGSPSLPAAEGAWDQYLSSPASADGAAGQGAGAHLWHWVGFGTGALGVTGAFAYYVKHDFFAPYPPAAPHGTLPPPVAPGIRQPGPAASKPGQTGGDTDPPPTVPKDGGTAPDTSSVDPVDSTSVNPTDPPPDGGWVSEPLPPKTGPSPPDGGEEEVPTTVTPEPATLVLLTSGLAAVLFLSRRRRRA